MKVNGIVRVIVLDWIVGVNAIWEGVSGVWEIWAVPMLGAPVNVARVPARSPRDFGAGADFNREAYEEHMRTVAAARDAILTEWETRLAAVPSPTVTVAS